MTKSTVLQVIYDDMFDVDEFHSDDEAIFIYSDDEWFI